MGNRGLIDGSKGVGVKSSNKNTLFFFWFYLINQRCFGISIYKDNQNTTTKKEINKIDGLNTSKANVKKVDQVNGLDIGRPDIK